MNKKQEINTKKIRPVGIRYFSEENNGIELTENVGYAFLVEVGENKFVNLFNPLEEYPLFERVPYTNVTNYGEEFGSKVALVSGESKSGPCYITLADSMKDIFTTDAVTVGDLEDYMLNSSLYFVDRYDIAKERIKNNPVKMRKIIKKDEKSYAKMIEFFEKRSIQLQKVNKQKVG